MIQKTRERKDCGSTSFLYLLWSGDRCFRMLDAFYPENCIEVRLVWRKPLRHLFFLFLFLFITSFLNKKILFYLKVTIGPHMIMNCYYTKIGFELTWCGPLLWSLFLSMHTHDKVRVMVKNRGSISLQEILLWLLRKSS